MAHWQFRPLNPNENSGASTVDDNFADEERTSVEILVRETLQNPLDARSDSKLVSVSYKLVTVDTRSSAFARAIFSDDWLRHFAAGGLITGSARPETITFLVVEDFGTTGLEGCFTDSSEDGRTQNWNAFWFREGEGAKPTRSNGGAGQGKITLYLASGMRSVFALTKRESDGRELLFGCCRFKRNYKLPGDGQRWAKEARWGKTADSQVLATPIDDHTLIERLKSELGLDRASRAGTSFIVPMPQDISEESLKQAVINEFFFAIRRGRLEVAVGDAKLDSTTIVDAANALGIACRLPKEYRDFLQLAIKGHIDGAPTAAAADNWSRDSKLTDKAFSSDELTRLKDAFELAEPVSVDFPISIKGKNEARGATSTFRVILQQSQDAESSQELFVRQDLGIDGEKRLKSSRRIQPVMALTFIQDQKLSELLVAAEEPTHRNWNAKRPKVVALFSSPEKALNAVRNAALRLVQLISPDGQRDETALSIYFADPASNDDQRRGDSGHTSNPNTPQPPPIPPIPTPRRKPVTVHPRSNGFSIRAAANEDGFFSFPIRCDVEVAYATTVGDSYGLWDAADFWLKDERAFPIETRDVGAVERSGNVLSFHLENSQSEVSVSGFDRNRQLDIRVKYPEAEHGSDIQND